jgi:hypothetical protein
LRCSGWSAPRGGHRRSSGRIGLRD